METKRVSSAAATPAHAHWLSTMTSVTQPSSPVSASTPLPNSVTFPSSETKPNLDHKTRILSRSLTGPTLTIPPRTEVDPNLLKV
ncbi:unnamed protein product [Anisakis simplex]|uniref:Uncharacterized protein n=1 Tax=Anisakis simplex TaxID=6269 RepID=A0A0M3JH31_ANISI|nr:unnamed protein product [Anisakis simplex]